MCVYREHTSSLKLSFSISSKLDLLSSDTFKNQINRNVIFFFFMPAYTKQNDLVMEMLQRLGLLMYMTALSSEEGSQL